MQELVMVDKLSSDSIKFICLKKCKYAIKNNRTLSKAELVDVLEDIKYEIETFC